MKRLLRGLMLAISAPLLAAESDLLYSSQFEFSANGLPVHRVRLREDGTEMRAVAPDLQLRIGTRQGPLVEGSVSWTFRILEASPARTRFWVVAERHRGADGRGASDALKKWRGHSSEARVFEVGSMFAVGGRTIDGRRLLVTFGPFDSPRHAQAAAASAGLSGELYTELLARPSGMLEATSSTGVRVRSPETFWLSSRHDIRVDGVAYPGDLYVTPSRSGKLALVAVLEEDRLLAGILPAEMPLGSPDAALKAQAVAARTELLAQIGERHRADPYPLCAETHCQVFRSEPVHKRALEMVAMTRGQVLLDVEGKLIDARWSACCGGHTEDNERVWKMAVEPELRGKPDGSVKAPTDDASLRRYLQEPSVAHCRSANGSFRWTRELDRRQLGNDLGIGVLDKIEILERGLSGRATSARMVGSDTDRVIQGELSIRRALGGLKSSLFIAEPSAEKIVLRGGGYGHGVGMCQTGAIGRAREGQDYQSILRAYYSGAQVVRLYP